MRLGGFVIQGDSRRTLARCLDSLRAVADFCVAVDCGSTDGSAELARARGVHVVRHPWEGYGAARAAAVRALRGCDYVFFLDSDEWLEPEAIATLRAFCRTAPTAPHYVLARRDWAELDGHRFLFRTERHVRLVRTDVARWTPRMIVHEALPPAPALRLPAIIEHRFADDVEAMRAKVETYALLWAIRHRREPRAVKPALIQAIAHLLREAVLKGALFRGGLPALRLAAAVARHHVRKYELLRAVRAGAHPELVAAFEEGRLGELFRLVRQGMAARASQGVAPQLSAPLPAPRGVRPRLHEPVPAGAHPPR
jgi:(heptosyl)LPS beta-1,4-glucosyltransferase